MLSSKGTKRVIITNVKPQVEGGKFPAKTTVHEQITISADIFCDGHDEIAAYVLLREEGTKLWKEYPLRLINNDHWEYSFVPEKTGRYSFRIIAWVDHYTTWRKGLIKKISAGQDVAIDMQIGALLLEEAAQNQRGRNNVLLLTAGEKLRQLDVTIALPIVNDEVVNAMMSGYKKKEYVSESEQVLDIVVDRSKASFSTWYELFPRSASSVPGQHGTFKDVQKLLPHIADMGFDTLYLPPIHPIGATKRKGKNNALTAAADDPGSPWAIGSGKGGHKSIHPQLGDLKDFKQLVSAAKKEGIEIAMDLAYQCSPDHPYVKEHPGWFKWRPDGTVQFAENPPKKYEDILPINFDTEDWESLWVELKSVIEYWIKTGVNIFRVDNPHTKSFPFWEWVMAEIKRNYPNVIFLAEAFTRPRLMERLAKVGFTQSYTYFTWRNTKKEIEEYITELTKTDLRYYFRPNFWPNTPDILPPEITAGGEPALLSRLVLAATLSSNYGLYGPVYELGLVQPMPNKEEYIDNEKYEVKHWDWTAETKIKEVIKLVNQIRKEHAALQTTWNIEFVETNNEQIICYIKHSGTDVLIIVVNLDPFHVQSGHVRIPIQKLDIPVDMHYTVKDLLSGEQYQWQNEWNYVQLNPYDMPAHILSIEFQNV